MPRVNPLRPTGNETNLAKRIAHERGARGWSYEGLARRMTDAGFPMQGSAVFKIEKGDPPRRITVDELVGFARVFGVDVSEMLMPIDAVLSEAALEAAKEWANARFAEAEASARLRDADEKIAAVLNEHPEAAPSVELVLRAYAEANGWHPEESAEYFMLGFRRASRDERAAYIAKLEATDGEH